MSKEVQLKQQMEALEAKSNDVDVDAEHDPETSRKASNAGLSREAAVQKKAAGEAAGGDMQAVAQQGVRGGGAPLPHLAQIQASFGRHDVSGVQAHTGGDASKSAQAMGAQAYATGSNVAFAGAQPDLHTAAHEAAHVVQQRGGVQLKAGVGGAGDAYEKQADQVADRVVAGKGAEDLLGAPKTSADSGQEAPVQMKGGDKDAKEETAPTPEEKATASKTADADSRAALSKSILLLTKHLHMKLATIKQYLGSVDAVHTGAGVDEVLKNFDAAIDEISHVRALIAAAKLPESEKGFLFGDLLKLDGVRGLFDMHMGKMKTYVATANATLPEGDFKAAIDGLFAAAGGPGSPEQSVRTEPSAEAPAMQNDAIKAHLTAAIDAATSAAMGNAHVDRLKVHILEIHELAPSQAHGMKAHRADLKKLLDLVTNLEKSHPEDAEKLRQPHALLKALNNLAQ